MTTMSHLCPTYVPFVRPHDSGGFQTQNGTCPTPSTLAVEHVPYQSHPPKGWDMGQPPGLGTETTKPKGDPMSPPTIAHILAILGEINWREMETEITNGADPLRAASLEPHRGHGVSDPTADTATNDRTDPAEIYRRHVDAAYRAVLAIAALADAIAPRHQPRRTTIQADTRGCALHERAGVEQHHPACVTTDFASVLEQPLREPVPVCVACRDFTRRHRTTPTTEQILRHERTGKWTQRTDGKRSASFTVAQIVDEWQGR